MKKRSILLTLFISFVFSAFSQGSPNPACVGYIYVDVDLNCDKTERGYASYPVPTPGGEDYGLIDYPHSQERVSCMGPGVPYITQFTEEYPLLHVRLKDLEIMDILDSEGNGFAYIDAPIQTTISNMGNPWSEQVQCYYSIILVINKEWSH